MAHNNHRRFKTCAHCGRGYVATTLGLRWVNPTTYEVVPARDANSYYTMQRYWFRPRPDQAQLVRAQTHEIACARRMGRPVERY